MVLCELNTIAHTTAWRRQAEHVSGTGQAGTEHARCACRVCLVKSRQAGQSFQYNLIRTQDCHNVTVGEGED